MIKLPDDIEHRLKNLEASLQLAEGQRDYWINRARESEAELQRLNATAQPVSDGWVKCSERMPKIPYQQDQFIVYTDSMIVMAAWFNRVHGIFKDEHNGCAIDDVTHWMPLPAAPGGRDE